MDASAKGLRVLVTADRLFGDQYYWSVLGAGRNQMFIAAMSAVMGGNVRVGLQVAAPDEARQMLKLKGGRNVAF